MKSYPEARDYLYSLRNRGAKYGLERMRAFAEALGNPQNEYPVIHVAGTNGKGSVCAMLEQTLRASGLKTGLYTSPHLVHQGERVQVNRRILAEPEILAWTHRMRPVAESLAAGDPENHPSFFEFMTAMAFLVFREQQVDCAVIETGLGGRLDATNVVARPVATAITSIALDHTDLLGDTIEKIAWEKAGILKPGIPVGIGRMPAAAEEVIRQRAEDLACPVHSVREHFGEDDANDPTTNLSGRFQRNNAATASLVLRSIAANFSLSEEEIASGLQSVDWTGRWQHLPLPGVHLTLDCTHNLEGARMLEDNLRLTFGPPRPELTFIFGSVGEGRARPVFERICPYAKRIFLVCPNQPRARTHAELRQAIPGDFHGEVIDGQLRDLFPGKGLCSLTDTPHVVLTGSIYLVGEACERLQGGGGGADLQDAI